MSTEEKEETALTTATADIAVARENMRKVIAEMEEHPEDFKTPMKAEDNEITLMNRTLGGNFRSMPVTQKRLSVFLTVLAQTGSPSAASRAATPWSTTKTAGLSAFQRYMDNHPEFEEAYEEAKSFALARVEAEISRRAFTPVLRPIVSRGEIIAHEEKWDNRMILRQAEKLDPSWSQKQEVKHSGKVDAGVLAVPMVAASEQTWEKQFEDQEYPALDVGDAELVEDEDEEDNE